MQFQYNAFLVCRECKLEQLSLQTSHESVSDDARTPRTYVSFMLSTETG